MLRKFNRKCEICDIFKNTSFTEHRRETASVTCSVLKEAFRRSTFIEKFSKNCAYHYVCFAMI